MKMRISAPFIFVPASWILLAMLSMNASLAQEGWTWQNPLPQGNDLHDVYVFEDNRAIAVGDGGTIVEIDGSGQIVRTRHVVGGHEECFRRVSFGSRDVGYISGDGFVLKTVDGGTTWVETGVGLTWGSEAFSELFFVNDSVGWAASTANLWAGRAGAFLRTVNGGDTWTELELQHRFCTAFCFLDADTGWAILDTSYFVGCDHGGYTVPPLFFVKTTDGGGTWEKIAEGAHRDYLFLFFVNDTCGWRGGYRWGIERTRDGVTWVSCSDSVTCEQVHFVDAASGWALIESDSILYTDNGGDTWKNQAFSGSEGVTLSRMHFNSWGHGCAVGMRGHIRIKPVGKETWTEASQSLFLNADLYDVKVVGRDDVWVCGTERYRFSSPFSCGVLLHTTDGGMNWEKIRFEDSSFHVLTDMFFLDARQGWAVGNNFVVRTTDAGETWEVLDVSHIEGEDLMRVFFRDSLNGWAMASGGKHMLKTVDGGATWVKWEGNFATYMSGDAIDMFFYGPNLGWLVGANTLFLTFDGGQNWHLQKSGYWTFHSIQFFDSLEGWVSARGFGGEPYSILHSTDGGFDWVSRCSPPADARSLTFHDRMRGYAYCGTLQGSVYYTSNGGADWQYHTPDPSRSYIRAIAFADDGTGWAVGRNGVILKTTMDGIATGIDEDPLPDLEPVSYCLHQNYPNPFNPRTTIHFGLPHTEYVTLKVYNVLGEEVSMIVEGKHGAGMHHATWDASGLPSGVYFYRLTAGEYVQTNKMVLTR
jgi:photosystem II stability/assembly factor-like uncharacterized protein